jgi:Rab3 GTPase-activating protein catalytic subunit
MVRILHIPIRFDQFCSSQYSFKGGRMILLMIRSLAGLLALFKQKVGEGRGIRFDSIMMSARFSYLLKDWTNSTWTQEPPDFDFMQGETLGVAELGKLPFGATFDPVG